MLPELTQFIKKKWNVFFPSIPHPHNISYLAIPGAGEGGTVTFLAFLDAKKQPAFSVKVYRDYDSEKRAQNEASVLNQLKTIPTIATTVPEVICVKSFGENWIHIQSMIKGAAMEISTRGSNLPSITLTSKHFNIATDWLICLGTNTYKYSKTNLEYLYALLDKTKKIFIFSPQEKKFLKKLESKLSAIAFYGTIVQHGDFCRQNILLFPSFKNSLINVIDWSDSSKEGIPLADLLFFLTTYYLKARKHTGISGLIQLFETTFCDSNPYSYEIWNVIYRYIKIFKISLSDLPFLMSVILIQQACHEYDKLKYASNNGTLPKFTLALAKESHSSFQDSLKQIPWFYFFQVLVKHYNKNEFQKISIHEKNDMGFSTIF